MKSTPYSAQYFSRRSLALPLLLILTLLSGLTPLRATLTGKEAEAALAEFVNSPGVDSTALAVEITDLATGKTIVAYNDGMPLVPASIMKASTTGALLSVEGPSRRYNTRVYTQGKIRGQLLDGDLMIVASGDPSLGHFKDIPGEDFVDEIVDALKQEGITEISGKIKFDETVFEGPAVPPSWMKADLSQAYGTGCHGFNYQGNRQGKSSVANPRQVFLSALMTRLDKENISVGNAVVPGGASHLLVSHQSAPYEDIMRSCMMRSDNLYAEAMLRTLARAKGAKGTTADGAEAALKIWKKQNVPVENIVITDGSGLSRNNRLTARFMTGVLKALADNVEYASFFPLAGQEGTLKKFLADTPLDSYIAMKTGSMKGIQSYAGYLLDEDFAPTHAIVVISNNLKNRTRMREDLEKLLLRIFRQ